MARAFPALRHPPSAAPSPSCLPSLPSAILLSLSISLSRFSLFSPFLRSPSLLSARRLCFQPSSSLPAAPPFNLKVSAFRAFQPLPLVTFRYAIPPRYCVAIVALLSHPRYPPPRNSSLRRISAISPLSSSSSSRLSPRSLSRGGGGEKIPHVRVSPSGKVGNGESPAANLPGKDQRETRIPRRRPTTRRTSSDRTSAKVTRVC